MRSRGSTQTATNDPHASLSLFQPRKVSDGESHSAKPIASRAQSAKPEPREYSELFVGENSASSVGPAERIQAKAGSGKNFTTWDLDLIVAGTVWISSTKSMSTASGGGSSSVFKTAF